MGDEAILASELLLFKKQIPNVEFYILSFNPERTRRITADIPEVKKIVKMGAKHDVLTSDVWGILKTFARVDAVVIGGGGLFQDIYNHYPIPFFTVMALCARLYKKTLILFCLGIGPMKTSVGKFLCRCAVSLADFVSVRDVESKQLLRNVHVKKAIYTSADPVFMLQSFRSARVERLTAAFELESRNPIVIVCVHELFPWKNKHALAKALDTLKTGRNAIIIFLPLGAYGDVWFGDKTRDTVDAAASKKIMAHMATPASLIAEELAPGEILALLSTADVVLSMRFHGLVLGMTAGVPVVALSVRQESKLRNLMCRMALENRVFELDDFEPQRLWRCIAAILDEGEGEKQRICRSIEPLQASVRACLEHMITEWGNLNASGNDRRRKVKR